MKKLFIISIILLLFITLVACNNENYKSMIESEVATTATDSHITCIESNTNTKEVNDLSESPYSMETESSNSKIKPGQANTQVKSESTTGSNATTANSSINADDSFQSKAQSTSSTENIEIFNNNKGVDLPIDFFD